jgi:hypothetical protein
MPLNDDAIILWTTGAVHIRVWCFFRSSFCEFSTPLTRNINEQYKFSFIHSYLNVQSYEMFIQEALSSRHKPHSTYCSSVQSSNTRAVCESPQRRFLRCANAHTFTTVAERLMIYLKSGSLKTGDWRFRFLVYRVQGTMCGESALTRPLPRLLFS